MAFVDQLELAVGKAFYKRDPTRPGVFLRFTVAREEVIKQRLDDQISECEARQAQIANQLQRLARIDAENKDETIEQHLQDEGVRVSEFRSWLEKIRDEAVKG